MEPAYWPIMVSITFKRSIIWKEREREKPLKEEFTLHHSVNMEKLGKPFHLTFKQTTITEINSCSTLK